AFFYFQGSLFGTKAKGKKAKANGESADSANADEAANADNSEDAADKSKSKDPGVQDDSKVKQVIELQPFIINLADKGESRYLRLTINLGVGGEKGEEKADPL